MNIEDKQNIVHNFMVRNIDVQFFDDREAVKDKLLEVIPAGKTVGIGHSATIQAMKLTEELTKMRVEREWV